MEFLYGPGEKFFEPGNVHSNEVLCADCTIMGCRTNLAKTKMATFNVVPQSREMIGRKGQEMPLCRTVRLGLMTSNCRLAPLCTI